MCFWKIAKILLYRSQKIKILFFFKNTPSEKAETVKFTHNKESSPMLSK